MISLFDDFILNCKPLFCKDNLVQRFINSMPYPSFITAMTRGVQTGNGVNHCFLLQGTHIKLADCQQRPAMSKLLDEIRYTLRVHHYAILCDENRKILCAL